MAKFGFPTSVTNLVKTPTASPVLSKNAFPVGLMVSGTTAKFRITVVERNFIRAICIEPPEHKEKWMGSELLLLEGSYVMNHNPHIHVKDLRIDDILEARVESHVVIFKVLPKAENPED